MKRILIPRYPGAFSAIGLALADVQRVIAYVQALAGAQNSDRSANGSDFHQGSL